MAQEPTNRPAKEFRLGHVKATIWANPVKGVFRHSVTLTRLYKEGSVWKASGAFGRDDLPLVERVAAQAHAWIYSQGRQATEIQAGSEQDPSEDLRAGQLGHEVRDEF